MSVAAIVVLWSALLSPQGGAAEQVHGKSPAAWGKELSGEWNRAHNALRTLVSHERNARRRAVTLNQPYVSRSTAPRCSARSRLHRLA